ncbi:MAG: hypothetical protein PHW11_07835 [Anaerolineaceae bacterium]|nr:hypothetical protein [Anaerolineaceae bacterium]MDD4042521.1 hypothetical protein [Anaerolineaceae bacterium]MDD4578728.1 hypothetical protein [Anaerolineaceae bacterium]
MQTATTLCQANFKMTSRGQMAKGLAVTGGRRLESPAKATAGVEPQPYGGGLSPSATTHPINTSGWSQPQPHNEFAKVS